MQENERWAGAPASPAHAAIAAGCLVDIGTGADRGNIGRKIARGLVVFNLAHDDNLILGSSASLKQIPLPGLTAPA
jgi:hypothetical protein